MRVFLIAAGLAVSSSALAEETAPPPPVTVTGGATLTTDYRFRGISQSNLKPAIQGTISIAHESGFYVTAWGSSVSSYVTASGGADMELDLSAGWRRTTGGTTVDVGALYYVYPREHPAGDQTASNFIEPYLSVAQVMGPVTAKVTANWAPKQKALALDQVGPAQSNFYLGSDLSAAIPTTPLTLNAHVGHTWGPSWLALGNEYTDWSLGASATFKAVSVSVSYVDTDGVLLTPSGKNAAGSGVVASIGVAF